MQGNINKKQVLNRLIRDFIEDEGELSLTLDFCEGLGKPHFKITIEMLDNDSFIDDLGHKWVREK